MGGVDHGPNLDNSCGPMGTYDLWMNATYAPEVAYLQKLVAMRARAVDYFVNGSLALPLVLSPQPGSFSSTAKYGNVG